MKHIDSLFLSPTNVQFYPVRLSDVMRVSNSSVGTLKSLGLESKVQSLVMALKVEASRLRH